MNPTAPRVPLAGVLLVALASLGFAQRGADDGAPDRDVETEADAGTPWGHSHFGSAYDEGPRQKPWIMEGIGSTPFPITTSDPEVQVWFDQAITLLHGFWYHEAERSLRWCLKLDPDCAMAYWALTLAVQGDAEREAEFLAEAVERKELVSARERRFIEVAEAFAAVRGAEGEDAKDDARAEAFVTIDQLLMDYPDDIEAKALYWLMSGRNDGLDSRNNRYGKEAVLADILAVDPDHVGALHYRVHTWDGEEGRYAIDSCMRLPEIAPGCGHLLHMPGHVLSSIGMWHEAAIAMDRATRVEKAYMHDRMILPEDNWDYAHNLDYLGYIQEQLGMPDMALLGAAQLSAAPPPNGPRARMFSMFRLIPRVRALVKFERWEEILEDEELAAIDPSAPMVGSLASFARCRALIGLGRIDEADEALEALARGAAEGMAELAKMAPPGVELPDASEKSPEVLMLEALIQLEREEWLDALATMNTAAQKQAEHWHDDPPMAPSVFYNALGDAYLRAGANRLAISCYEKTLEMVRHDGFALAGLVVAHHGAGHEAQAREAMAALRVVWSDAERPNRWLAAAEAAGIEADPFLDVPLEQRNYVAEVLDVEGPSLWIPTPAPELVATDARGEETRLDDYLGQPVILVFYLGDECVHCMEQIQALEEQFEAFADLDCAILASSKDSLEEIAEQSETLRLTLLSDPEFENAKRFQSFDDFEEIELHSTFLIDAEGRVHWSRIGGEPFADVEYLRSEVERLSRLRPEPVAIEASSEGDEQS